MLIINAKIITMDNKDYENGYILINNGKIIEIGEMHSAPKDNDVYDAQGGYAIPGMIDAHCHLGVFGDSIGFEGEDGNENPEPSSQHLRIIDAINPLDRCFLDARNAGVTTVVVSPGSANALGGQIVAVKTNGIRVDDIIVKQPLAVKVAFGENPKTVHNEKNQSPITRMATASLIRQALFNAQDYIKKEDKQTDLKSEVLVRVLKNEIPLHAHAHRADDIFTAIRIAKEFKIDVKIVHGTEGHLIADELAKDKIDVMVGPSLSDRSKPELTNLTFKTAGILEKAGVRIALVTDHPVIPINYLLLTAQLAVKNGMTEQGALRAITIDAAGISGIDDKVGKIAIGYDADIAIFDKNPMEFTANIKQVIISGVKIDKPNNG